MTSSRPRRSNVKIKTPPLLFDKTQTLLQKIGRRVEGTFLTYWTSTSGSVCDNDVMALHEVLREIGPQETITLFVKSDGREHWSRWELRPWREADGTVGGIVLFSEDISKRMLAEQELKHRNEELERFNLAAIDRELRMIELKRQVNAQAQALGQKPPYDLSFTELPAGEGR